MFPKLWLYTDNGTVIHPFADIGPSEEFGYLLDYTYSHAPEVALEADEFEITFNIGNIGGKPIQIKKIDLIIDYEPTVRIIEFVYPSLFENGMGGGPIDDGLRHVYEKSIILNSTDTTISITDRYDFPDIPSSGKAMCDLEILHIKPGTYNISLQCFWRDIGDTKNGWQLLKSKNFVVTYYDIIKTVDLIKKAKSTQLMLCNWETEEVSSAFPGLASNIAVVIKKTPVLQPTQTVEFPNNLLLRNLERDSLYSIFQIDDYYMLQTFTRFGPPAKKYTVKDFDEFVILDDSIAVINSAYVGTFVTADQ